MNSLNKYMNMKVLKKGNENQLSYEASKELQKDKRYLSMQKTTRRFNKKLKLKLQKTERPLVRHSKKFLRVYPISPTESSLKQNIHESNCFKRSRKRSMASKARLKRRKTTRNTLKRCTGPKLALRSKENQSITRDKSSMYHLGEALMSRTHQIGATLFRSSRNHQIKMVFTIDHGEQLTQKVPTKRQDLFCSEIGSLISLAIYLLRLNTKCPILQERREELVLKDLAKGLWKEGNPRRQLQATIIFLEANLQIFGLKGSLKKFSPRTNPPFNKIILRLLYKMRSRRNKQTTWPSYAGREKPTGVA